MIEEGNDSHFLIAGRRCGECEDTVAYICVAEDQDPETVFIREILYGGQLSDYWEERLPTYEENSYGDWAHINGNIELPYGVTSPNQGKCAVELDDFRLEEGKFSAVAIRRSSAPVIEEG